MARRNFKKDFGSVPAVWRKQHTFDMSHRVATSMKVGRLHPIDIVEVLPGDVWDSRYKSLIRLTSTFVRPIMDYMYLDTHSFFIPLRLLQDNLEDVFGDSSPSSYDDPKLAECAHFSRIASSETPINIPPGSVGDYLGLPSDTVSPQLFGDISVLPFRANALCYDEYYRSEQVDNETYVHKSEIPDSSEMPNNRPWSETNYTGMLPPVCRYKDYFSSAVLRPQKGPAIKIPGFEGAPVSTSQDEVISGPHMALNFRAVNGQHPTANRTLGVDSSGSLVYTTDSFTTVANGVYPSNLVVADSSDDGTISALRTAVQLQKYLERDAIYGSRYREYLYAAFGVVSPDARLQVPEFLSGAHNIISISQVVSTSGSASSGDGSSYPVGQVAGMAQSLSSKDGHFRKRFTEHGYILTLGCIRYKHLYSQAVARLWRRTDRNKFFDPLFANLSMQAVYLNDFYGGADYVDGKPQILGYQEPFADYRTIWDRVSGQMRPQQDSLGQFWSLADYYADVPSLADVVHEQTNSFDRVITTPSSSGIDPFVVDFGFIQSVRRSVPLYGMPGYMDHH